MTLALSSRTHAYAPQHTHPARQSPSEANLERAIVVIYQPLLLAGHCGGAGNRTRVQAGPFRSSTCVAALSLSWPRCFVRHYSGRSSHCLAFLLHPWPAHLVSPLATSASDSGTHRA